VIVFGALAALTGAAALVHGASWTALSVAALKKPGAPQPGESPLRFAVLVPAHNEEELVAACVRSLQSDGYEPSPLVVVVADNCTDRTAARARDALATVVERWDDALRGKSFALDAGLHYLRSLAEHPQVVVVVDGDSRVLPGFFAGLAAALNARAPVAQAYYAAEPGTEPLIRLRGLALRLVHWSRPLGMSRLGLGMGLKGNGMAFRWEVVRGGFPGQGITEDADASLDLARQGITVAFAPHARVLGHMAANYAEAAVQDRRWEGGRLGLARKALGVAARRFAAGDPPAAAAALDVASLPLSLVSLFAAVSLALGIVGLAPLTPGILATGSLVCYLVVGLAAARAPLSEVAALAWAPRFLLHKSGIYANLVRGKGPGTWERTARPGDANPGP
jgi:Glycosyltransferase like family 2